MSTISKERARLVPAAAVTPALQVDWTIIGPKTSVAGHVGSRLNAVAKLSRRLEYRMAREREAFEVLTD